MEGLPKKTPIKPGKSPGKRTWSDPSLEKLPPLTDLTLQTGDPVLGDEGVF